MILLFCDTLLIRRPVVHGPGQDWIPACAGMTDQLSLLCIDDVLRGDIDVKARGA